MSAYYTMNPADLPALLTAWQSGSRVLCPCKEQDGTTRLESFVPERACASTIPTLPCRRWTS